MQEFRKYKVARVKCVKVSISIHTQLFLCFSTRRSRNYRVPFLSFFFLINFIDIDAIRNSQFICSYAILHNYSLIDAFLSSKKGRLGFPW